jgi:hypothetical protein
LIPLPFLTSSAWFASKYGAEKAIFSARSGVIVIAAAAMSHLRALRSSPDWMPSNGVSTIACLTPSSLATRSIMSTSKPTILPPRSNWNGW